MSALVIAIPCALGAAVAYGAATAVQHAAAYTGESEVDARGLVQLVRNPRWLVGIAGDTVGLVLQVIALSTGPVALIQPLLVLALPVSLPIAWWLGGPRPARSDGLACLVMIAGLAGFFALLGDPGRGVRLARDAAVFTFVVMVVVGVIALVSVNTRGPVIKAAVYGTVAGAWFGLVAVLLDATSIAVDDRGLRVLARLSGALPLLLLITLGIASIALTQAAFQIGPIAASFPANLAADPLAAVVLGAVLLKQNVSHTPLHLLGYAVCFGAILYSAIRLAAPHVPAREAV